MASTDEEVVGATSTGESARTGQFRFALKAGGLLLLFLILIRTFLFAPYAIPTDSMSPTIRAGDVLLVNKLPYWIRTPALLPFTDVEIPYLEIPGLGSLDRGDVVVLSTPEPGRSENADQLVKRVVALPGDRVRLDSSGLRVRSGRTGETTHHPGEIPRQIAPIFSSPEEVTIPYSGYNLPLDGPLSRRWNRVLRREGVEMEYRNNIIFLNGRPATRYLFEEDYLVVLGDKAGRSRDSRSFGLVRRRSLIGEAVMVIWSRDEKGMRWGRIGQGIE